ncbi:Nudix hydrolase 16, mitochondrial [Tetrabaena socialis]|uniref:Nudix hydrolase 16, mitochondrial n=1 Tax=Tetrabaena socialis TaxID=47790 RepID=A0A2J8A881_9CHLO|nr:Nudix hydrolase 16, mitochondrial [Tetrabaena socialis]|eukprot:PNH08718.1 Nudix hydrolase 16, mitochondrial [Tetrabaena socialis]
MAKMASHTAGASHTVGGPIPAAARTGRLKQRYGERGERLVAGCIPVKLTPSLSASLPESVQVCMITTTSGKGLVFPKGGWEDDESLESVRGVLEEPMLGVYAFSGGKQAADAADRPSGVCKAHIFVMHVEEELPTWPESEDRQRVWCSLAEACRLAKHDWMREAIQTWVQRKGWGPAAAAVNGRAEQPAGRAPELGAQRGGGGVGGEGGGLPCCGSSSAQDVGAAHLYDPEAGVLLASMSSR